jgi:lysozyme family protein
MSSGVFTAALNFVLRWEGGFVDHPKDPGGRTNKGITQKVYDCWRARRGEPPADVRWILDAEVEAIYESDYWLPPRCDLLQEPLALLQFDTAVNMGVGRAVRLLQAAVGTEVDGDFGPRTLRCARECDVGAAALRYCDDREAYYRRLSEQTALRREIGLPGFESAPLDVDFGDADFILRIPDVGEHPDFDL